jgi:hypothetical protein
LKKCNAEVSKEIDSSKVILMSSAVDITDVAATLLDQLVHQAENMLIDIPSTPTNINQRWQVVGTLNCDSEIGSTLASLKNAQLQVLENVRNQQVAKATSESGTKMLAGAAEQARQLEQLVELEQARQLHDLELELEKARKEPQCSKTQFTNSEGVQFIGCDNPLAGDENEYEWKLWENALKDGDLCLATDVVTGKQYALTQDECH